MFLLGGLRWLRRHLDLVSWPGLGLDLSSWFDSSVVGSPTLVCEIYGRQRNCFRGGVSFPMGKAVPLNVRVVHSPLGDTAAVAVHFSFGLVTQGLCLQGRDGVFTIGRVFILFYYFVIFDVIEIY